MNNHPHHHYHHTSSATKSRSYHQQKQKSLLQPKTFVRNELNSNKQYEIMEVIGSGAYGELYKAVDLETNQVVALKVVDLQKDPEGFPISTLREILMLKNLKHQNIVNLHDIVIDGKDWSQNMNAKFMLALDYYPHDFSGIINDKEVRLTQAQIKSYIQQLLAAVDYLHKNEVMHRDLKTSNILLARDGTVKLTDFGLSCFRKTLTEDEDYQTLVVTRWYRSPELLLGESRYNYAIDMWSVGCILAEFMQGTALFRGANSKDQLRMIFDMCGTPDQTGWTDAQRLKCWPDMKPETSHSSRLHKHFERFATNPVLDLLSKLLCLDPSKRITAEQALSHEWFTTAPLPNKAASLPDSPRNELWIKNKTAEQYQAMQQATGKRSHSEIARHENVRSGMKSHSFISQSNEAIHSTEPHRKQRRFNASDANQNHYRSTSSSINPPIRPTIGRPGNSG